MTWKVLLFAHLRERHGDFVTIESEPTVDAVLAALAARGLEVRSSRLAADDEFVRSGEAVRAGATLALIPPVSGG